MMTFRPSPRLGQACPERSVGPFRASTLGSTLSSKVAQLWMPKLMPKLTNFRPSGPCPDGQVWTILGSAKPGPKACSAKSACARDRPIPGIVRTASGRVVRTLSGRVSGPCPDGPVRTVRSGRSGWVGKAYPDPLRTLSGGVVWMPKVGVWNTKISSKFSSKF